MVYWQVYTPLYTNVYEVVGYVLELFYVPMAWGLMSILCAWIVYGVVQWLASMIKAV